MLTCDHPSSSGSIGVVQCQKALVNALIERWHPNTHMFHLPIGEYAVTLEDVAQILGLLTDGLPVTGMTMSSFEALEAECLLQFGVAPRVHWKFLPWLRDFGSIGQYSWGSACLAHLYRALCRASHFDCKEIDGPLTLLLGWAWIRLPYLSPLPRELCSFSLANRWHNWERGDRRYRYLNLAHFRKAFDELQEGQVAYYVDRVDPNIIPAEIYMQSIVWSATLPLVSFECIEWHATDRYRRQFDFVQRVPHQAQNLDKAHGEVLTGPKNLNWATAPSHSFWVMHWINRYNHVLSELSMPSQHPLDTYMYWYRSKFGDRLNLSNLVGQENDEGNQDMDDDNEEQEPHSPQISPLNPLLQEQPQSSSQYVPQAQFTPSFPIHQQYWSMSQFELGEGDFFSQLLGFMAGDAGQSQYGHQTEFMAGRYSLDARHPTHTSSVASGGFVSVDSSRSAGGRGVLNSQNSNRVSMGLIEENANTLEQGTDAYLVDDPDDEDDHEEDEIEEFDEDEESRNNGIMLCILLYIQARTPDDKVKGYNLRIDPPRRSANRYTPSVFKKVAKKCKNFVKDVKWPMRK
ncbi:hypothetical protein Ahy_B06g085152 [Arachis hypogaea]|uniref:Aminotransferase-like plant mobile domain-containing protein n=1 Tax=Arachis hypogaea TaxID=3818 RepID=A0A444YTP9_ARAHY|nr:hypothetical protein Ahy_B06g085152 [Arachis hypogaea]